MDTWQGKNYLFWMRFNNFSFWWLLIYMKEIKAFCMWQLLHHCEKTTLNILFELQLDCNHNSQIQIHLQTLWLASINVEEHHFQKGGWLKTQIWWTKEDIPILEWSWLKEQIRVHHSQRRNSRKFRVHHKGEFLEIRD